MRWVGALSARKALYIMLGAAVLGVVGELVKGDEPGFLLGFFIIVGSIFAAIGIRLRSVYLLIPLPALTLFVTAVLTGAVHDNSVDTSKAALSVNFLQWIAAVFFPIAAATIVVIVIGGGRWVLSRQFVAGQFRMSGGPGRPERGPRATTAPGPRVDRDRRPSRESDPWGAAAPAPPGWDERSGPAVQGVNRAQKDPRDPWGNRRQPPPDRGQPGNPQPAPSFHPNDRPPPPDRPLQPERTMPVDRNPPPDRALPPGRDQPGQRDQWDGRDPRGTTNQRANRDPRDPWGQR